MVGVDVRIPVRLPFDAERMAQFLAFHLVPGIEAAGDGWYARSLRLPHGYGVVRLDLSEAAETGVVHGHLTVTDLRDVGSATERCRRLLDAGCDPDAVDAALRDDPALADSLRRRPGLRVPGHVDGDEVALRTVLGQQVSLKAANRLGGVLVELAGDDLPERPPPRRGDAGLPDPGRRGGAAGRRDADAAQPAGLAGGAGDGAGRRGGRTGPQRGPARDPGAVAGAEGDRTLDGRLRADAGPRGPGRLPARRRGGARGARRPRRERTRGAGGPSPPRSGPGAPTP